MLPGLTLHAPGGPPAAAATLEIVFVAINADSTEVGITTRDSGDIAWPNTYSWRTRAPAGISQTVPFDEAVVPSGNNELAFSEYYVKQRNAIHGLPVYVMPHGWNGTGIAGGQWGVGGGLHESSITRANAAVAGILAANPGAVPQFTILVSGGSNDGALSGSAWEDAMIAATADFRARVYRNGLSGAVIGNAAPVIYRGFTPEHIGALNASKNPMEYSIRRFQQLVPNSRYRKQPEGQGAGDNLHPGNAGQRADGIAAANIRDETTAPVLTFPATQSVYVGQKFRREIVCDKTAYFFISGPDADQFEIVTTTEGNGDNNINNSRSHWHLQLAGNASLASEVSYSVTVNAIANGLLAAPKQLLFTGLPAYGSQVEPVVAQHVYSTIVNSGYSGYVTDVPLKRGLNVVFVEKSTGSVTLVSTLTTSAGLVGAPGPSLDGQLWSFYLYSAEDQTVDVTVAGTGNINGEMRYFVVNLTGTAATAGSSSLIGWTNHASPQTTEALTLAGEGIIVGAGNSSSASPTPGTGVTTLNVNGTLFTGYRTTSGAFSYNNGGGGGSTVGALAFDKASGPDSSLVAPVFELGVDQSTFPITGSIEFDSTTLSTDGWTFQVATDLAFTTLVVNVSGTVGTGSVSVPGLSDITSGKHYIRTRTSRSGAAGPWSTVLVHGDAVDPVILSSASATLLEDTQLSLTLESDKTGEVVWSLFGGVDVSHFEIVDGVLRFSGNGTKNYDVPADANSDNQFVVQVRATDMANNYAVQVITVSVTDETSDNPIYTEWTENTGGGKHNYLFVSGDPAFDTTCHPSVGTPVFVRAKRATTRDQFQLEVTVNETVFDGYEQRFYIGVDDGTTDLGSGYPMPGFADTKGVLFEVKRAGHSYIYNGRKSAVSIADTMLPGDVYTLVVDRNAGTIKLFHTRGGVTTQMSVTVTLPEPWANFNAVVGMSHPFPSTTNFGQASFVRALDEGYGVY